MVRSMPKLLPTAVLLTFALLPGGCAEPPSIAEQGKQLGFSDLGEVRAYVINPKKPFPQDSLLLRDGSLNPEHEPDDGVVLSASQVQKLVAATTGQHPETMAAACYNPHHGFLFADSADKTLGHLSLCFSCNTYSSKPQAFADDVDWKALAELVKELGLPVIVPPEAGPVK